MLGKEHSRKSDRMFKGSEVRRACQVRGYERKKKKRVVHESRLEKQEGARRQRVFDDHIEVFSVRK